MHSFQALALSVGLLAHTAHSQLRFPPSAAVGIELDDENLVDPGAENVAIAEIFGIVPDDTGRISVAPLPDIQRQDLITVGPYVRTCPCTIVSPSDLVVDDIRDISDRFVADGNTPSAAGLSNMVWGFGQFLDHDLALTIEDEESPTIEVESELGVMRVHPAFTTIREGCRNNLNVHTNRIDAGPIYGSDRSFLQNTLREPGTCRMRTAGDNFVPVSTVADTDGRFFMIAGDVRVSEHAFLAAQHIVWVREHNRICEVINDSESPRFGSMSDDQKFNLAQNVVIAKFQQVVLTEFLPALGISQADLEEGTPLTTMNQVSVEFSIAYRLGHDLIGNSVGDLPVAGAFNSEGIFLDVSGPGETPSVTYKANTGEMVSNIMLQLSTSSANEIDGKLSNALRNMLFDMGEDLAGRNIFRGRELGLPTYAGLAECYGTTPDAQTEAETPDAWLGLLREPKAPGAPLPPTLRAILIEQFHRSFFSRRGNFWRAFPGRVRGFVEEIERTTYADIISANTGAIVTGNVFKTT